MQKKNLHDDTVETTIDSLATNTTKQYNSALKYWWNFCLLHPHDPFEADDIIILRCLTERFKEGAKYGTINSLRSAIALINTTNTTQSQLIQRFFKGVFKLSPIAPKYNSTWDVSTVLKKLESWKLAESLNLRQITLKLAMLLALGSAFRVQSLTLIKLDNINTLTNGVEIKIQDLVKTSRPGGAQPYAFFPFFNHHKDICIARTLLHYIEATKDIKNNKNQLFLSYKSPHKEIGSQTISRWLKEVMIEAGIDQHYTAHSTRHASTSKALRSGVNLNMIKNAAGWSENSSTFARSYNRPIEPHGASFAEAVFS